MAAASKRKLIFVIIIGVVLVGLGLHYIMTKGKEFTDDAAIESHISPIAPKIKGYVTKLYVNDNQLVKKGDVLLEIDPTDYQIALDRANAGLAYAQSKLEGDLSNFATTKISAPSGLSAAQSDVASAQAEWINADKNLKRMQQLGDLARTKKMLDDAIAAEKTAKSQLDSAQAHLRTAETVPNTIAVGQAAVSGSQAAVAIAKAAVAQAQQDLDNTKIVAPFDGRITRKNIEIGAYIQPGQQLLTMVSNEIWVVANYKETQITDMKPGQVVDIEIDSYPGKTYKGKIDSMQSGTGARFSLFPPENATGNFVKIVQRVPVKILFTDQLDQDMVLGAGMSVLTTVHTQ